MLYKIRGLVITSRISSDFTQRMITKIKEEMDPISETRVSNILNNKNDSGPSPGYECSVYMGSKNCIFYHTINNSNRLYDSCSQDSPDNNMHLISLHNKISPEEMAEKCCIELLKSTRKGGIFDSKLYPLLFTLMALGTGLSVIRIGILEEPDLYILKMINEFIGVKHTIFKDGEESFMKIIGCGYINKSKIQ